MKAGSSSAPPVSTIQTALNLLLTAVEEAVPLPARFRSRLPRDVVELSRLLTTARNERKEGYLSRPDLLSAYLRYFMPWNVFRLLKLFECTGLPGVFVSGDVIIDMGSGPLTLPLALWVAFPGLRRLDLEFRCIDKSAPALEAGKRIFAFLAETEKETAWRITVIHDSLDAPIRGKKAKLVSAVNVLNEAYRRFEPGDVKRVAALLVSRCSPGGSVLVMEPGNPQGGACVAALRSALLERGLPPVSPCPHTAPCPMPGMFCRSGKGTKAKWCHFAFDTEEAPAVLHKLSSAAGLPKERAAFSFLLAGPAAGSDMSSEIMRIRIISDPFPIGERWGRYGCSTRGLVLITGNRAEIIHAVPFSLLETSWSRLENVQRDPKTGALEIPLTPRKNRLS